MNGSKQTSRTYGDMAGNETGCRVIVAVFGADNMCIPSPSSVHIVTSDRKLRAEGSHQASLVGRVQGMLEARGLEILRMEQSSEPGCFALLIHARTSACSAANLVAMRRDLEIASRDLGVTIRVQREELFVYMHRI